MSTPAESNVFSKVGSTNFYFSYNWVSPTDGKSAPIVIDELDIDGTTVLSTNVYWLAGAGGGSPVVTPVPPLNYAWQTGGPYFRMRRAPYPDEVDGDTWAGTLIDSSATVKVYDFADQPTIPVDGGPAAGEGPTQKSMFESTADADPGTVLVRNLWSPRLSNVTSFVPTTTLTNMDVGTNFVAPDDWYLPGFTGAGDEALSGSGWIQPVAFVPANADTTTQVNDGMPVLPAVQFISGREDGFGYPDEVQLFRHLFTMPTYTKPIQGVTLKMYARGTITGVVLNGVDLEDIVNETFDRTTGESLVSATIPPDMLIQGESNLFAFSLQGTWVGTHVPNHFLPWPNLARAMFVGYALWITV